MQQLGVCGVLVFLSLQCGGADAVVPLFELNVFKGYTYFYSMHDNKLSWNEARDTCINIGAELTSVSDIYENKFLISKMRPSDKFWIGLVYNSKLGRQVWTDQKLFSFGQLPNTYPWRTPNASESASPSPRIFNPSAAAASLTECTYIYSLKWYKESVCSSRYRFVCKRIGSYHTVPLRPVTSGTPPPEIILEGGSGGGPSVTTHQAHSTLTLVMAVLVVVLLLGVVAAGAVWAYRRLNLRNRARSHIRSHSVTNRNPDRLGRDLGGEPRCV